MKNATKKRHETSTQPTLTAVAPPNATPTKPVVQVDRAAERERREGRCSAKGATRHEASVLGGANVASLLVQALTSDDGSEGVVATGLECIANEVSFFVMSIEHGDATTMDPVILASVMRGIENRLRVLAEISKRSLEVSDAAEGVAS